jgi:hypothetical protein
MMAASKGLNMIHASARTLALLVPTTALLLMAACGGSTTSSGTTGTGTTGTGTITGATGSGGAGGSPTTTGTGGAAATGTTGSAGPGGSSSASTSASSSTGGVMGACTDDADKAIAAAKDLKMVATMCALMNNGAEPATKDCIKSQSGLSDPCVACYDTIVTCTLMNCASSCTGPQGFGAPACQTCLGTNCLPAFQTCSGPTGG